ADHVALLAGLLPRDGLDIIRSQLQSLASADHGALTFGFVTALVIAFWSANNGIKSLFEALNIAYEEREKRSFLRLNLMAFAFTLGAMVIATGLIVSVGVVPAILALLHLDAFSAAILAVARWPIILVLTGVGISILYRFGPSRRHAQWRWISWGSALATIIWIAASAGFSFYLQNFANYNATYGSLGAVIGLMLWTWISVVVLLVGAELNAEMEHQTAMDTTTGRPRPMGKRGAVVADTLGRVPPESED
ncbi:YihY/virulence factor BrkB family protein, partial [Rhizobiaceae sp. 2RAB30]